MTTQELKHKATSIALGQYFSWLPSDAVEQYKSADTWDKLEEDFIVWEPFESWETDALCSHIDDLIAVIIAEFSDLTQD